MGKRRKRCRRKREGQLRYAEFLRLKRWVMSLFVFFVVFLMAAEGYTQEELVWQECDTGIDEAKVTAICAIKETEGNLFAGADRSIYKSEDFGESWQGAFLLKGERRGVNLISYDPVDIYRIFAATSNGLYISSDGGKNWLRSFRGRDELQRDVVYVIATKHHPSSIYVGTKRGLFQSKDAGRNWSAVNIFTNKEVVAIAEGVDNIYVCAIDGVYRIKDDLDLWDRVYIQKASERENGNGDDVEGDFDEDQKDGRLYHIACFGSSIYLATDKGPLVSKDKGESWQLMNTEGLLTRKIRFLLPLDNGIFAATEKGVFYYNKKDDMWRSISSGLASPRVNSLSLDKKKETLYAASGNGLYRLKIDKSSSSEGIAACKGFGRFTEKEPSISEVQQAAIRYAEVSPEKIKWMRQAAANKAWLPKVTAGLDGDVGRTIDLDRGGTSNPDFYIEGPKDKNRGWDITATWDLGDMIWNPSQTSIDVRSRLMVQLRNDILDEVDKLYFERRRLQIELAANPPKTEKQMALKDLRLQELTADIDSLTGGYFSQNIKSCER